MKHFPVIACCFLFLFCNNVSTTKVPSVADEPATAVQATGMIAYIRNSTEIRVIDSSGQNDRRLWTHPDLTETLGIFDVAWRPDGKELAFSSGHEAVYSLYKADLYAIRPDGSGLRKITNSPDRKGLAKYKKGTVTVTFKNFQYSFQDASSSAGIFFVNIAGCEEPQQVLLPPGATKTITFKNVADLGEQAQPIVAIYGAYRWFMPGTDVVAGSTVKAPEFIISGDGIEYFGAFRPVWKSDGTAISYRDGYCLVNRIPANPGPGIYYEPLFGKEAPQGSCVWDWGPGPMKDQVLYSDNEGERGSGFFVMKEGGNHDSSKMLALYSDTRYQLPGDLRWLPDGSGFLYSAAYYNPTDSGPYAADIFRYDMKTKKTTQITHLRGTYARGFCISPDGQWIVYERCPKNPGDAEFNGQLHSLQYADLWKTRIDGSGEKLLVKNALSPSWSR